MTSIFPERELTSAPFPPPQPAPNGLTQSRSSTLSWPTALKCLTKAHPDSTPSGSAFTSQSNVPSSSSLSSTTP
ncbi:hypothetical protein SAMD00023353_1500850 [Rosellinia necatrix]|uniref:Uncharacterized protein n=1 Tax=Rosellinia necatrix TaxID=77044 RepID=A0A1S8A7D1_ROSNE|nr:hypothetical protein SAMD00023353_1500850 [Rosellinia necatrix]